MPAESSCLHYVNVNILFDQLQNTFSNQIESVF